MTLPDATSATTAYSVASVNNRSLLKILSTDALANSQASYIDGSGKTVLTEQYLKSATGTVTQTITTSFEFDAIGQLVKVTDAKGKATTSTYDKLGRRTLVNHPASGRTYFKYDLAGNLVAKQTANMIESHTGNLDTIQPGKRINYYYTYNRLDSIAYPGHPENNVRYWYGGYDNTSGTNCKGRVKYMEDGSGAQEFAYGKMGEIVKLTRTLVIPNQAVATYVTRWGYDCWNRVNAMMYPDGESVYYYYDLGGNLKGVGGDHSYIANITYDKFGQRTSISYGNGSTLNTTYTYDPKNRRMSNMKVTASNTALMNNSYSYDLVGNILGVTNTAGVLPYGMGGNMSHTYTYDNLYRLSTATGSYTGASSKSANYSLTMGYDELHNIVSKKQDIGQTGVQFAGKVSAGYDLAYSYNSTGQQLATLIDNNYRYEGSTASGASSDKHVYVYDSVGNMVYEAKGKVSADGGLQVANTRRLLWDEENRLSAVSDDGYASAYLYDASGERTVKMHGGAEGVSVNGKVVAARLGSVDFTAYVSPYLVVSPGATTPSTSMPAGSASPASWPTAR